MIIQGVLLVSIILYGISILLVLRLGRRRWSYGIPIAVMVITLLLIRATTVLYDLRTDNDFKDPPLILAMIDLIIAGLFPVITHRITLLISRMNDAQRALQTAHDELEQRVIERTTDLEAEIAERTRVSSALSASEHQMRLMVQNLPMIVNAIDEDHYFVIWNREAERVTGYSANEMVLNPKAFALLYPDPDYRAQQIAFFNQSNGSFRDLEVTITCKDGSERVIAWSNVSRQYPIPGWRSWAIGVDVTERKHAEGALRAAHESLEQQIARRTAELRTANEQLASEIVERRRAVAALQHSENQLRSTLDALSDYVHVVDQNLQIILVNKAYHAWNRELGLETHPLGRTPRELVPALPASVDDEYQHVFDTGQILTTEEVTVIGDLRIVTETRKIPIIENGRVTQIVTIMRDITDQRKNQDMLHRTQFTLDHAPVSVFWIDANARLLYANNTACETLGYTRAELLTMTVGDIDPSFLPEEWSAHWAEIKAQGRLAFESSHRAKDGREYPTEIITTYLKYGDEEFNCAFVRDISSRKRSEEALRQSEDRFKRLYEHAPLGYQSLDENGYFIQVNEAWQGLLGYERDDVIGRWFGDFLTPESRQRFRQQFPIFKAEGAIRAIEFEMVCKNDQEIVVSIDGRVGYDLRGNMAQTHCILVDITERKETELALRASEERFRVLVDSMDDIIFTLDTDQRHTALFGRWVERAGLTPDVFLGKTSREILGREAAAVHETANARALVGEHVIYEWTTTTSDDETHFYQTSLSPMWDADDNVTGIVGVGRDITALKKAEQVAIRAAVERQRAQILTDFIRDTSHEFANPLSVVKNSSYLALHTPDDAQRERHIKMINGQIFHIERLVQGMILMSRLDGGVQFRHAPVYLDAIFDTIETRLQKTTEENDQTLILDLDPNLPQLMGDHNYLHMAIANIVENAVQYTQPGGTVSVQATESADHPGHVVITVADTGIGIAEEFQERIFERFFRIDRARTERGAGLGLPIAESIITQHSGWITVESALGYGSTFRIFLPITDE